MTESFALSNKKGVRQLLSGREEIRAAIVEATAHAERAIAILTPDLEPDLYDQEDFLECLKRFLLARSFARVRVLITQPSRALKSGNNFVSMGRRLNSYIEFRNLKTELGERTDAFFIADQQSIVYRTRIDTWDGIAEPFEPAVARYYLDTFDELWHACAMEPELRHSQL
jgi:hypothetical protein